MSNTPVEIDGALVSFDPLILKGDSGTAGAQGVAGPVGATTNLTMGTVTSVPSGQSASASLTGTAPNQVLNLVLPAGPTGAAGANGTGSVVSVAGRTGTVTLGVTDVSGAAALASPAFTGTPTSPTPTTGDSSTKVATTAFVAAGFLPKTRTIDFIGTCGGVADALQVGDAAITSGSHNLSAVTARWTSAHVGKPIVVGAAGASSADLVTTISAFTDSTHVTLTAAAGTTQTATGATWGTDNSAAMNTAITALQNGPGGTVDFGPGRFAFFTAIAHTDFGISNTPSVKFRGVMSGTQLFVCVGSGNRLFDIANLEACVFEDLTFVGTPLGNADAKNTIYLSSILKATIRNCNFYGLSTGALSGDGSKLAIIGHDAVDLKLERVGFHGCCGASGKTSSIVLGTNVLGFHAEDSVWVDWGYLDGFYHNKSITNALSYAWVHFDSARSGTDDTEQSAIRFVNCRMDEYALFGIFFNYNLSANSWRSLVVDGHQQNVSWSSGAAGVYAWGVTNVLVANSYFTYRTAAGLADAVNLGNCTIGTLRNNTMDQNATQVTAASSVGTVVIEDCVGFVNNSSATITRIYSGGPPQTSGLITPGHMGKLGASLPIDLATSFVTWASGQNSKTVFVSIPVPEDRLVGHLGMYFYGTGSGFTTSYVGLYSATGTQLGISADLSTPLGAASGHLAMALTSPVLVKGGYNQFVYAALLFKWSTTAPSPIAAVATIAGQGFDGILGNSAGPHRVTYENTTRTALPASWDPTNNNNALLQVPYITLEA